MIIRRNDGRRPPVARKCSAPSCYSRPAGTGETELISLLKIMEIATVIRGDASTIIENELT